MLPFSGNNTKHKNVRSPPEHFAIGYVHNLPLGNNVLQYIIQKIAGRSDVFSDDFLHFLKIKKKIVEFTKTILWL